LRPPQHRVCDEYDDLFLGNVVKELRHEHSCSGPFAERSIR
jgi:hypothetical protein